MGLRWRAIDFVNDTLSIEYVVVRVGNVTHFKELTKNDSSYAVLPLPDIVKSRLLDWKVEQERRKQLQPNDYIDSDFICTKFDGNLLKQDYLSQHFRLILNKRSLADMRFHDLRHSAAGFLKHLGFDLKDIQVWLRHASLATTSDFYLDLNTEERKAIGKKLGARYEEICS